MLVYFYVVSYSIKVLHTTTDGSLSHVLAVWCWARDYHAAAAATPPSFLAQRPYVQSRRGARRRRLRPPAATCGTPHSRSNAGAYSHSSAMVCT